MPRKFFAALRAELAASFAAFTMVEMPLVMPFAMPLIMAEPTEPQLTALKCFVIADTTFGRPATSLGMPLIIPDRILAVSFIPVAIISGRCAMIVVAILVTS